MMEDANIVELLYSHDERGLLFTKEKYNSLLEMLSTRIVRNKSDAKKWVNDTY